MNATHICLINHKWLTPSGISETTASSLTSILYELAKTPDGILRLRNEITALADSGKHLSNQNLQSLDFLNGVINETLRLHPPTGLLQRKTPSGGIMIGETYVPGDVTVFCPFNVVGRSKSFVKSVGRMSEWLTF